MPKTLTSNLLFPSPRLLPQKKIMNAMSPKSKGQCWSTGQHIHKHIFSSSPINILLPYLFSSLLINSYKQTMSTFTNPTTLFHTHITQSNHHHHHHHHRSLPLIRASLSNKEIQTDRRKIVTTLLATSLAVLGLHATPLALAENWGTRSFLRERFFEPGLSAEDAVARIRQTAEGLHSIRDMLETMSWRYVLFYIRLKQAYLSQDMKNAMTMVPESKRKSYVKTANELVDNMAEFDYYVRTPKIYESYVYYEKTLKSIDDLVALLA